jgi:hypothetical protein
LALRPRFSPGMPLSIFGMGIIKASSISGVYNYEIRRYIFVWRPDTL